ncbi:hypothetical protein KI387_006088, partial [Taxus chinensis]
SSEKHRGFMAENSEIWERSIVIEDRDCHAYDGKEKKSADEELQRLLASLESGSAGFNYRPAVHSFSVYAIQISAPILLMDSPFFVIFQFASCYAMIIRLKLQKSGLGLPFSVMNNTMFSFFKSIPSWKNEEGRFHLEEKINQVALPAIVCPGVTLVVSPLVSLIQDQIMHLSQANIPATYLSANMEVARTAANINELSSNCCKFKLLYVTPEKIAEV